MKLNIYSKVFMALLPVSYLNPAELLAAIEHSDFGPSTRVTLPVYDRDGVRAGSTTTSGDKLWQDLDDWERKNKDEYRRAKESNRDSSVKIEEVSVQVEFDRELGEQVENVVVPQDLDQIRLLARQGRDINNPRRPGLGVSASARAPIRPTSRANTHETSLNKTAGSNSAFSSFVDGKISTSSSSNSVTLAKDFSGGAHVFGRRINLITTTTKSDPRSGSFTSFRALDTTIFTSSGNDIKASRQLTRSVEQRKRFLIGPIPLSIGGKASGNMSFNVELDAGQELAIQGRIEPGMNIGGRVDAAIDILIVRAGVEGTLTILDNRLISSFNTSVNRNSLANNLKVENNLTMVKGKINIFARVFRLFRGFKKFTKTIFSFDGISENRVIFNQNTQIPF